MVNGRTVSCVRKAEVGPKAAAVTNKYLIFNIVHHILSLIAEILWISLSDCAVSQRILVLLEIDPAWRPAFGASGPQIGQAWIPHESLIA